MFKPMGRSTVLETVLDMVGVAPSLGASKVVGLPPPAPPDATAAAALAVHADPSNSDQGTTKHRLPGNFANCTSSSQGDWGRLSQTGIW